MSYVGDEIHERFMKRLAAESKRLVNELRKPIDVLAAELLKRETMTGEEAEAVVRDHLPPVAKR